MNIRESFLQAFACLKSNRLRSFLTMLGVVMGVFSVITIVTVGDAAKAYMNMKFEQLGANIIEIKQKYKTVNEDSWLHLEDMDTIRKAVDTIKDVSAISQNIGTVRIGSRTRDAVIIGTTPAYKNFRPFDIIDGGRFIIDNDQRIRNNVVVVSESFSLKYFNTTNVIGKTIEVKFNNGTVADVGIIGVANSEESTFENLFGDDLPVFLFMPVTTVQMLSGTKRLEEIIVSVADRDKIKDTGVSIVRLLEFVRGEKGGYMAGNSADMQKTVTDIMDVIRLVLLVIAVVTLFVGGIGIINILLVSVTERIREIGIKKALGAQKKDIILQFLTESVIMTGTSGLTGIFLGVATGNIASALIKIPQVVSLKVVIASFTGSVILGILFGVYPAKRAADLDPIQSLRYE
jgi:putative ABC transport system permease protein